MPNLAVDSFSNAKLEALPGKSAMIEALSFMPNLTVPRGTLLGQLSAAANVNEVQTLDWTGNWTTGDVFTLGIVGVDGGSYTSDYTFLTATPSAALLKAAIEALLTTAGYGGVTVTVSQAAPTDATITFGGAAAAWDMPLMTAVLKTVAGNGTVLISATTAGVRIGLWGPYVGTKLADQPALPTVAYAGSGGYIPDKTCLIVQITHLTAQGESLPSAGIIAISANATNSLNVTPATLPSGVTGINVYLNGVLAKTAAQTSATVINVPALVTSLALGTIAGSGLPRANTAFTNTDGRHIAKAIAMYDFRTDEMGRVAFAGSGQTPQRGAYEGAAPAYFSGAFKNASLWTTLVAGITADALADLKGRLIKGTLTDGVFVF